VLLSFVDCLVCSERFYERELSVLLESDGALLFASGCLHVHPKLRVISPSATYATGACERLDDSGWMFLRFDAISRFASRSIVHFGTGSSSSGTCQAHEIIRVLYHVDKRGWLLFVMDNKTIEIQQ